MVIITEQSANACEKGQPLQLNVSLQLPIVSLSDTNNEQEIKLVYSSQSEDLGAMKVWWSGVNNQLVLLSWATGSISSGNLFASDINSSKAHKIAGNSIVTNENNKSYLRNIVILSTKLCHHSFSAPYPTDNNYCSNYSTAQLYVNQKMA